MSSGKVSPLLVEGRRSPAPGELEAGRHKSGDEMTTSTGSLAAKLTGKAGAKSSSANQSPGEPGATKSRGGLSCLRPPATLDEDTAPLVKSPERKQIMSPSGKSISDIFGKVKLLFCVHWGESLSYKSIL